jgi:hypothetical protein
MREIGFAHVRSKVWAKQNIDCKNHNSIIYDYEIMDNENRYPDDLMSIRKAVEGTAKGPSKPSGREATEEISSEFLQNFRKIP